MIEEIIKISSDIGGAITGFSRVNSAATGTAAALQGVGGRLIGLGTQAALFTAPLTLGLGVATSKAVDFDTAISGASRALDLGTQETKVFGDQVKAIAPALGQTPTKFAELATNAGKLGVSKDKIMGFTKVVAEIAAITDLSADETEKLAESFAALQTITGANTDELNIYGAAVNKLDDAIGGTTPRIIEFTRQTAASGKLLGLGIKDLAAYGSAMQALGIQNGVAYRSFNALMTKLAAPQTLSKKAQESLQDLGLSAQQMAQVMTTDANAGIKLFLDRINAVSKVDVSRALGSVKQIIGQDYGDEILTLAAGSDKLAQALSVVGDRMDKANLDKKSAELAKKLSNVKGQQAILSAQMERFAITIGQAVLPNVTDLLGQLTPLIDKFAAFAEQNPRILKVGMAIAAVAVSAAPVLIVLGSLISAVGTISTLAAGATPILAAAGGAIAAISAPVWLTVGAFVAAGAIIGVVIARWSQISQAISNGFSTAINEVLRFTNFIKPAVDFIVGVAEIGVKAFLLPWVLLGAEMLKGINLAIAIVSPPLTAFGNWLSGIGRWIGPQFVQGISIMGTAATQLFGFLWQGAVTALGGLVAWVYNNVTVPLSRIVNPIAQSISRDLIGLWNWVVGLAGSFFQAGASLAANFANGIRASFYNAVNEFKGQLAQLRGMLPGSEPKRQSPLSNLADAGAATMQNFAQGFGSPTASQALNTKLSEARSQLTLSPSSVSGGGGGGSIVVQDNRSINFDLSGSSTSQSDIIELLRRSDRELLDLLNKAQARWGRAT